MNKFLHRMLFLIIIAVVILGVLGPHKLVATQNGGSGTSGNPMVDYSEHGNAGTEHIRGGSAVCNEDPVCGGCNSL